MIKINNVTDLASILEGKIFCCNKNFSFTSYSIDNRKPADLFFALTGINFDGHDFIHTLPELGFKAAVVERLPNAEINKNLTIILVNNVYQALCKLAVYNRNQVRPQILAITGSAGKTTTKEMLVAIFNIAQSKVGLEYSFLATQGNLNNYLGVPLTLLNLQKKHHYLILEIGTSTPGEIAQSTLLARPDIAAITNIFPAHLSGLGNIDGVRKEKLSIYSYMSPTGIRIESLDDINLINNHGKCCSQHKVISVSTNPLHQSDYKAIDIEIKNDIITYILLHNQQRYQVTLNLLGRHNVSNSLIAIAMAHATGLDLNLIIDGLRSFSGYQGRLQKKRKHNLTIIDDTYNANYQSMLSAIDTLKEQAGNKVLLLGDMAELGDQSTKFHLNILQQALNLQCHVYFYGDNFAQAGKIINAEEKLFYTDKQQLQHDLLKAFASSKQPITLLIKASRATALDTLIQPLFDAQ